MRHDDRLLGEYALHWRDAWLAIELDGMSVGRYFV